MSTENEMPFDDQQMVKLLGLCNFRASTSARYRTIPHAYIIEGKGSAVHDSACREMRRIILSRGYDRRFGRVLYRYYHLDGFKYWFDDEVLNRETLEQHQRNRHLQRDV